MSESPSLDQSSESPSVDQSSESALSEQDRVDVLLDGLKNVFYSRLLVYFAIIETILIVTGYAIDIAAGAYSESTNAAHVMAGILGVFAIFVAALFLLILLIGVFFVVFRTVVSDV